MRPFALLHWLYSIVLLFGLSHPAPQSQTPTTAPSRDLQAMSVLQNSIKVMGGAVPSDSIATGTIQTVAGSQTVQGTIRILTRGTEQSLVQITTPATDQTCIFSNGRANEWNGSEVTVLPLELVVTSQTVNFPIALFTAMLNDPDTSFQYVGLEASNGSSLYHVQAWDSYASQPSLQDLAGFSMRDIWIDASTGLPQRISYVRRPAHGAVAGVTVDVFFSNYQNSGGVLYPLAIQDSLNGTLWATIDLQSISFDTGLTDSNFPVQ